MIRNLIDDPNLGSFDVLTLVELMTIIRVDQRLLFLRTFDFLNPS